MRFNFFTAFGQKGVRRMNTMRTSTVLVGMFLLACLPGIGAGQEDSQAPGVNPKVLQVQLKGTVDSVSMARGMGPATVTLKTGQGASHTIRLGPVRFLVQKGFNLTVGDQIEVQGFVVGVVPTTLAVEVKNLTSQKTIRLRGVDLRPLWARGRNGPAGVK